MKRKFFLFVWIMLIMIPLTAQTPLEVQVAAYPFQPYFSDKGGRQTGILPDLLDLMNRSQDRWHFRIRSIPANRRYLELEDGSSHLIFFEDKRWSWENRKVEFSSVILQDSERFLTLRRSGKDEKFFQQAESRPLIAVRGYHYQFADHITDETVLRKRYQIALVQNQDMILEALDLGHGESALITESFFVMEARRNPRLLSDFLLSLRKDQEYELRVIFSRASPFTPADWSTLLNSLRARSQWEEFFRSRGLETLLP